MERIPCLLDRMVNAIDFQLYIQSLCRHYAEWWTLYTLTDVEGRKVAKSDRNKRISPFDFDLMVRSINNKAPETSRQEKQEKLERQPVLKGLRDSLTEAKHVLLIGRPGSGKSTALARLLLEEAQHSQETIEETFRIPVLVELRYYQTSVIELIRDFFRRYDLPLETHQVETLLSKNRLLLLIDGLNELSSKEAARQDIAKLRNYRNVPMIFTTRDLSLGGDFGIEKQWEMLPLTETQMQTFIRSHLSPEQADSMWRQLKDRIRKFAETPLLLWMLCELFEAGEEIPRNLGEVFRIFTQTYENSSIRKHEVAALKGDVQPLSDRRLWFPALKHLASVMMQGETPIDSRTVIERGEVEREFKALFRDEPHPAKTARDCLDDLLNYHLLQIKTDNEIEFRHQLIQEYYAAEWLLDRLPELSDEQLKYYFLNYLKWTEAIGLMLGLPEVAKEKSMWLVKLALGVDLMLGARLAGKVRPKHQIEIINLIADLRISQKLTIKLLSLTLSESAVNHLEAILEDLNPEIRKRAVEALIEVDNNSSSILLLKAIEAGQLETCDELSKMYFLHKEYKVEMSSFLIYNLESAWQKCLINSLKQGWFYTSYLAAKELSSFLNHQSFMHYIKNVFDSEVFSLKVRIILTLERIIPDLTRKELQLLILGIDFLLQAMQNQDPLICEVSGEALESLLTDELVDSLEPFSKYNNYSVKSYLNQMLLILQTNTLKNKEYLVRRIFCRMLNMLDSESALNYLESLIKNEDIFIRESVVKLLTEIDDFDKRNYLFHLALQDECPNVRLQAIESIGSVQKRIMIEPLIEALKDENRFVRQKAHEVLYELDCIDEADKTNEEPVNLLENYNWRKAQQEQLGLENVWNTHPDDIKTGIWELEKVSLANDIRKLNEQISEFASNNSAYNKTFNKLWNEEFFVRWGVAFPLKHKGRPECLSCLKEILKLHKLNHVKALYEVILGIQTRCKFYNYEIAQSPPPPAVKLDSGARSSGQTINIESVGNFNAGGVTIHGNQIGDTSNG